MPQSVKVMLLAVLSTLLIVAACDENQQSRAQNAAHDHEHDDHGHADAWKSVTRAIAVLTPTEGNTANGVLHFEQLEDGVRVHGEVRCLTPNQQHAFHAHQWGDISANDGTATGGHYNPEGVPHGLPGEEHRHAGDFGNLEANAEGVATVDETFDNISVAGMMNPIIGRGLIVHAEDDKGTQPTGDAGGRIAQAVIGIDDAAANN